MTTRLVIVDGPNWFRRRAQKQFAVSPVRTCYNEIQSQPDNTKSIIVWDGRGGLKVRRDIFEGYKVKRTPPPEEIFQSQGHLKEVLKYSNAIAQVEIPGWEGDDVIAHLHKKYSQSFDQVIIESNDLDLYQLGCQMSRQTYPVEPQWVRLKKTLVGDSSDNIPGLKGFGETAWNVLDEDQKLFIQSLLTSDSDLGIAKDHLQDFLKPGMVVNFIQNYELLKKFWTIIGFLPIDNSSFNEDTFKLCTPDANKAEALLSEYMQ